MQGGSSKPAKDCSAANFTPGIHAGLYGSKQAALGFCKIDALGVDELLAGNGGPPVRHFRVLQQALDLAESGAERSSEGEHGGAAAGENPQSRPRQAGHPAQYN